ncbi:hypothetical protein AZE42_10105 [Rhizopogon vesiculosus]|uniref:Uncharacterized protein n=1 Tax=Rhizopogon vesiculosus TaxID=180088 RepID=A0A1J8PY75_9AGAM|nr:hypothetical protein AZE42_10105 [Rhizopogon vesiculosus]
MVASPPSSVNYPPLDGSLFLSEMLEFNAQHNSDVTFFTSIKLVIVLPTKLDQVTQAQTKKSLRS